MTDLSVTSNRYAEDFDWRVRVFDSLSLPALILSPDRGILNVNRNFLKKYGVTKEQIVGGTCHEFFYNSEDPCPYETCPLPRVLAHKEGQTILRHITTPSGEDRWEDRIFSPILDDEGEVRYIIESIRDVTQVKALEKELSGIKKFMERLIQSSTSGIIAADRNGRILLMNKAAEELTGYTLRKAQKEITIRDLYLPGRAKEIMRKLRDENLGGRGKLPSCRGILINARKEQVPVDVTAAIIYEGDREVATMGIFNDLSEKLAQEERMNQMLARISQAEKMASLGLLAAGVAHEINNPLTGILLYAGLVRESLENDDPRRQDLQYVMEDANRCRDIVKNLLMYSRQTVSSGEILQINDLVEQSLSLIRDQKLFMHISVIKELSNEMMLIHADRNHLSQVVINLVINAADAMDRKGVLTIRTYRDKPAKKVYLEISDTGCGIPKENLSKIFDPFFTTKEPGKGTGLGLSTVYGIVKDNGGNIWVKGTSSKGTTFIIELPLYQAEDDAHEL